MAGGKFKTGHAIDEKAQKFRKQLASIVFSAVEEKKGENELGSLGSWCAEHYKQIGCGTPGTLSQYVSALRSGIRTSFLWHYRADSMEFSRRELERFPKIMFLLGISRDNPAVIDMEREYPDFRYPLLV